MKVAEKNLSIQELKDELKEIKSWKNKASKDHRLKEIAKQFASDKKWDLALEALELISDEKERNLSIADLIDGFLLPTHEITLAKKFAKYLTPVSEIGSLIEIRIALADKDTEQAESIAERLPSPLSRNFAFLHIMESYFGNKEKNKEDNLYKKMLENVKTIYDSKSRSYILRELALNLFLPNNKKERAIEISMLIPDETIRTQTSNKIHASK